MVETRTPAVERETIATSSSRPHHRDGCLSGLGCSSRQSGYMGSLVGRGTPETYQPPGVVWLAVQTYTKDKTVSHVHLRMDNQTAV